MIERLRSRQRQLQRALGDAGRVLGYEATPTSDLPAAGWYARIDPEARKQLMDSPRGIALWEVPSGLVFLGSDHTRAAAMIGRILDVLDAHGS